MDETQREALAGKKVAELQTMAVEMGLAGKGLKKAQLIDAILTGPSAGGNGSATAAKAAPRPARRPLAGARGRCRRASGPGPTAAPSG